MSKRKRSLPTRIAIWWLKNYDDCVFFWVRFNWTIAMTIFIIGALKGINLGYIAFLMIIVGLILNTGLLLTIRGLRSHLLSLEERAPGREEAHALLIRWIQRKIQKYEKE